MKSVAVLAVICCLALGSTSASPVPSVNDAANATNPLGAEATGRQASASVAQPVAPAAEEDDDDDDDEDDIDLDITDDDDDDDDEEGDDDDDDDDDDYLERFIDDILGGDEDDDDDDETSSVVEPVVPAAPVQAVQPVQSAPSIPAAVQADLNALNAEAAAEEAANLADTSANEAESASYEDDEASDVVPEGQAASSLDAGGSSGIEGAESQLIPGAVVGNVGPVLPQQATAGDSDEDDDDDDEDEDDLGLTEIDDDDDDDDEEEEEEEEEEDDDDDDDDDEDDVGISDIADARRARVMESEPNSHVPAIYVAKYNRFVDNILARINKILRANYDPVTVKLTNPSTSTKSSKTKSKKKSNKKNGIKNGSKQFFPDDSTGTTPELAKESATSSAPKASEEKLESATRMATTERESNAVPDEVSTTPGSSELSTVREINGRSAASTSTKKPKRKRTKNKNKTKSKKTKVPTSGSSTVNKNKTKTKKQSKPRARATLYGLSSLKRSGDVSVNMMSDHTTIKTKFSLGPLVLKVEKEFGRAAKKELRSATATTAEMSGKLSLRVVHGGAATLHSIRVLQPKQVRVESADDHDRTREFVWRRSSHIAHLVSQKLSSATRSMLRPPPIRPVIAA